VDANSLTASVTTAGLADLTAGTALTVSGLAGNLTTHSGSSTTFGLTNVGSNLSSTAGTNITQTAALTVGGLSSLSATGNISLGNAGNDFVGAVSATGHDITLADANSLSAVVTAGGLADLTAGTGTLTVRGSTVGNLTTHSGADTVFGPTSVGANLSSTAGTDITQTAAITVTGLSTLHAGGDIALGNTANDFGGAVSATATDILLADLNNLVASLNATGSANLTAGTSLAVSGTVGADLTTTSGTSTSFGLTSVTGDLSSTATAGDITQTDKITVGGSSTLNASGNIALGNPANDFGGTVTATATDILLADLNDLVASLNATGSANLTAGEALAVSGTVGTDLTTTSGTSTSFGLTSVTGDLSSTATAGDITQTDKITVGGSSTLHAGGNIALGNADNDFVGAVSATATDILLADLNDLVASLNATGSASLTAGEALTLSGTVGTDLTTTSGTSTNFGLTSVGGNLVSTAGTEITQTAALTVVGSSNLEAGTDIALPHGDNDFGGPVTAKAGSAITLVDANDLTASIDAGTTASLTATAGALTVSGTVGTDLTTGSGTSTSFGLTSVGGDLVSTAGEEITQTAALTVVGSSNLQAGTNIALTNAGNDFGGPVTATAGSAILLVDANDFTVSIDAGTLASLTAVTGVLTVRGTTGGDLTTSSGTSTSFGATNVGADLSSTAGGAITQTGALTVTGHADLTGGSIALGGANAFNTGTLTFNSGGDVSISAGGDTVLTGSSTAGTLTLSSTGTITDAPATSLNVTAGDASFTGSSITLADSAGDVLNVSDNASFKATTGGITVGDAGLVNFGSLTFNSTRAVVIQEDCCTLIAGENTANSLNLTSTEGISSTPNAKVTVTGDASFTGTSINLAGSAGNVLEVGGIASFTATTPNTGAITIGAAGTVNFGQLTFNAPGAVTIAEDSAMAIVGTNTAGSATLSATGALSDAGATSVAVTGLTSVSGASISLGGGTFNTGTLTFNSTGAVSIAEGSAMDIVGTNTAGSATLSAAGALSDAGATSVAVTGPTNVSGTSISLGGGTFNTATLTFNSTGAVSIAEDSATVLTGNNTALSLALSSTGSITESGTTSVVVTNDASLTGTSINLVDAAGDTLTVGGHASLTATTGGITIGAPGTVQFGSLTFKAPGAVFITEDSATALAGANNAGSLTLNSAGAVTQQAGSTITVTGAATINAGSNPITLINVGNDFQSLLTLIGGTTQVRDVNALAVQLTTGETYLIANFNGSPAGGTGQLTVGGTSGDLIAVSNGGVLAWNNLGTPTPPNAPVPNAILIAGTPVINGTANPAGITGPGSTGNVLAANVTYSNFNDARGNTLVVGNELVLIARDVPAIPSPASITAQSAVFKIASLTPPNQVSIFLNGELRLLVESGTFQFAGGHITGGVTTLNPDAVSVLVGGVSLTSTTDELAARSAISAAQQSALTSSSADARQSFGTDSVTQQIDMGFAGDVGIAPTMGHSVPLQGEIISTPPGVSESKGGQ
jgi:hypothetical protein